MISKLISSIHNFPLTNKLPICAPGLQRDTLIIFLMLNCLFLLHAAVYHKNEEFGSYNGNVPNNCLLAPLLVSGYRS
jgi:hypothetical protein